MTRRKNQKDRKKQARKPKGWRNEPVRHSLAAQGVRTIARGKGTEQHVVDEEKIMKIIGDVGPWKVQEHGLSCWKHEESDQFIHPDVSDEGKVTVSDTLPDVTDYSYGYVVKDCNPDKAIEKITEWMKENENFMVDARETKTEGEMGKVKYESNMIEGRVSWANGSKGITLSSPNLVTLMEFAEGKIPDGPVRPLLEGGFLELKGAGTTNTYRLTEYGEDTCKAVKKIRSDINKEYEKLYPELL